MSEDIASIGLGVDSTQVTQGTKNLDQLTAAAAGTTKANQQLVAAMAATNTEVTNFQQKVSAALQAQYGMSEASANAAAGIKAETLAIQDNNIAQIALGDNLRLNMAITKQRTAEGIAAEKQLLSTQIASAREASALAKTQQATDNATLAFRMRMTKQMMTAMAEEEAAIAAAKAAEAAETVISNDIQIASNEKLKISTLAIREPIVLVREAIRGDFSRMAGSATLLAQAFGLLTPATLPFIGAALAVGAAIVGDIALVITYNEYLDRLTATTLGLGQATGLTANQLDQNAHYISDAANLSVGSISKMELELVRMGDTDASVFSGIIDHLNDYVALSGEKAPQALKELGIAFANPIQGYLTITDKIGGFNLKTYEMITAAERAGDALKADQILMDALAGSTANAAAKVGGLSLAWSNFMKGAGNFFNSAGKIASDPLGAALGGLLPAAVPGLKRTDPIGDAQAGALLAANAQVEKNNQLNKDALNTFNELAPKHVEINKLLQQEALIRKSMNTPGGLSQEQGNEAISEANRRIAQLNKQLNGPKPKITDAQRYQVKADQVGSEATTTLDEATAYLKGDAAGQVYEARVKALKDAVDKKISSDEKNLFIQNSLNLLIAKSVLDADKQTAQLQEKTQFQKAANDEVGAGLITTAQATQQVQDQIKLQPLWNDLKNTQGKLYNAVLAAIIAETKALKDQHAVDQEGQLLKINESLDNENELLQSQIKHINDSTEAQARFNAELKEKQSLIGQNIDPNSPEGKKAITKAGENSDAQSKLNDVSSLSYAKQGEQLAHQAASDIKFNNDRVNRYAAAQNKIDQYVKEGTLTYEQGERAKTVLTIEQLQERLATTDKALSEIATLTSSKNKTLAAIGKAAAVIQATIDGTLAIQKTLASTPYPWNIPLAVAEGVAVAANIAKIEGAATGGIIGGSSPSQTADDKLIKVTSGEGVLTVDAVRTNPGLVEAANSGKIIRGYAGGGIVGKNYANDNSHNVGTVIHMDFSNSNFGGADQEQIEARFHKAMVSVYGPLIVKQSVQTTLKTDAKLRSRQTMNAYGAKG